MGTTAKALALLDLFSIARPSVGLSDLSRLAGVNKATCHRLLAELAEMGLVEQSGPAREYRIGPAVMRLAALREMTVPTRATALPVLERLAAITGETAHMSLLMAGRLITVAFAYGQAHGVRVMMEGADVLPFHATSSGVAVLAFMETETRDDLVARPLARLTDRTPVDPAELHDRIAQAARLGWATTVDTFEADVSSVALPLFSVDGTVSGALAVAAPTGRMNAQVGAAILPNAIAAAQEIMKAWGGYVPPEVLAKWQQAITMKKAG
jgi:DNA-binding IclR family transcriptional regulator